MRPAIETRRVLAGEGSYWEVLLVGNPASPPLIFLHGFLGSAHDWLEQSEEHFADYYCVLPTLPGCGIDPGARRPLTHTLAFDAVVQEFAVVLRALCCFGAPLVGYSLGGRVALAAALAFPELTQALILESMKPGLKTAEERSAKEADDQRLAEMIVQTGMPSFIRYWYKEVALFSSLRTRPELLDSLFALRELHTDAAWTAKVLCAMSPAQMPNFWPRISTLQIPVLLISGVLDTTYCTIADEIAELLPNCRNARIAHAGHNAHFEMPLEFAQTVQTFLADHK